MSKPDALSDADCVHPYCGWTGLVKECDTSPMGPRCPECGGEVKVFDAPSPSGRSEFALPAFRDAEARIEQAPDRVNGPGTSASRSPQSGDGNV